MINGCTSHSFCTNIIQLSEIYRRKESNQFETFYMVYSNDQATSYFILICKVKFETEIKGEQNFSDKA